MKRCAMLLVYLLCLFLSGCSGGKSEKAFEAFRERLSLSERIAFTAQVRAEYEDKTAKFTLSYEEDAQGGTVTVIAPELIAGIKAHVSPGGTSLEYDGVVLDTGSLDNFGLSPMSSLPILVQGMKTAHVDSCWTEGGHMVVCLEPDDERRITLWFDEEGSLPHRAEILSGGRVTVYIEISGLSL